MSSRHDRILVVDDDDAIRTMVERVLRREKYDVESARDGFEAIEKLTSNDYGTVLLDLMMPRLDGHGVLRYLEDKPDRERPLVIVMTANIPGAATEKQSRPIFRIMSKPFELRDLIRSVRECSGISPDPGSAA